MKRSAAICLILLLPAFGQEASLTADDLIERHLESMGPAAQRQPAETRVVTGPVRVSILRGGTAAFDGRAALVSRARDLHLAMKFANPDYRGERMLVYGGKHDILGLTKEGRSGLGDFLQLENYLLRDGLVGGTLSTAWPLLDLKSRGAKVKYRGLKKLNEKDLHELTYQARKGNPNTTVRLYFEPGTFRHVMTVYEYLEQVDVAFSAPAHHGSERRFRLQEQFSDFRDSAGLMLPRRWVITLFAEVKGSILQWEIPIQAIERADVDVKQFSLGQD